MSKNITTRTTIENLAAQLKTTFAKKAAFEELKEKVDGLVTAGGEPNTIEHIKLNGVELEIQDGKIVNITVPTKVSDLNNDSKFQTEAEVAAAVAAADHMKRTIVASTDAVDLEADDADQYIYMVLKSSSKSGDKYDEYMVIDGELEKVGDWEVDLSNYVQKEEGKGLSANDFTDEEKAKLAGITAGATKVEASETNGYVKINGVEVPVYTLPDTVLHADDISDYTAEEIAALLADDAEEETGD